MTEYLDNETTNKIVESIEDVMKSVQKTDRNLRDLIEEAKFITISIDTSVLAYKTKKYEENV